MYRRRMGLIDSRRLLEAFNSEANVTCTALQISFVTHK